MRVTVDSYIYAMIKITSLKTINISPMEYKRLESILEPEELLDEINKFFPGVLKLVKNLNLIEIEKALFEIYFRIYSKVLKACPPPMQLFLVSLLKRFEIWNIKTYIIGLLVGNDISEIKENILFSPEKILDRENFIDKLLSFNRLEDGLMYLKNTHYKKAITRGYYYFEQKNEAFLIEALLDKQFVVDLYKTIDTYDGMERKFFENYIHILVLKYNLMAIFRSISNNVPKELLKQLIIKDDAILTPNIIISLAESKDKKEFYNKIKEFLQKRPEFKRILPKLRVDDSITPILLDLDNSIFKDLNKAPISDLEKKTVENILILIFHKEREIFKVLRLFVRIFHKL